MVSAAYEWIRKSSPDIEAGRYGPAREKFEMALALEPQNASALYSRCLMSFYLREYERALEEADEACSRIDESGVRSPAGDEPTAMRLRSWQVREECRLALQRYGEALQDINQLTQRFKSDGRTLRIWHFVDRAAANVGVGRYADALKDLESAEEIYKRSEASRDVAGVRPYRAAMNRLRAEACFQLGKFADALAAYEQIAPIDQTSLNKNQAYLYVIDDWTDIQTKRDEARRQVDAEPTRRGQNESRRRWWQR